MLKKDLQVEKLYEEVRNLTGDNLFIVNLCLLVSNKRSEYLQTIKEDKCFKENPPPSNTGKGPTTYDEGTFEYFMWMNALITMCWLLTNVKKKTEDGHCHNPVHDKTIEETEHPMCAKGSEFHSKFYDDVVKSLQWLVKYATENQPKVIKSQNESKSEETDKAG